MIKSAKGQFILYIMTAILFVIASFSYIEFPDNNPAFFSSPFFYFLMILAVFNEGLFTQKYIGSKKEENK